MVDSEIKSLTCKSRLPRYTIFVHSECSGIVVTERAIVISKPNYKPILGPRFAAETHFRRPATHNSILFNAAQAGSDHTYLDRLLRLYGFGAEVFQVISKLDGVLWSCKSGIREMCSARGYQVGKNRYFCYHLG